MRRWKAHRGKIASLSFSRDGQFLASVTGSGRDIFIWQAATGELVRKLTVETGQSRSHYRPPSAVAFAPDADLLAVMRDLRVELWDTTHWTCIAEAGFIGKYVAVSHGPKPLLAVSGTYSVGIFGIIPDRDGELTLKLQHGPWVGRDHTHAPLAFSGDGMLVAFRTEGVMRICNPHSGIEIRSFHPVQSGFMAPYRFSPDSGRLAFCLFSAIEAWPSTFDSPDTIIRYAGQTGNVSVLRYTPDGRRLISVSSDGTVREWEAATGAEIRCFEWDIGKIVAADVSPDGMTAAVGGASGEIVVWDLD